MNASAGSWAVAAAVLQGSLAWGFAACGDGVPGLEDGLSNAQRSAILVQVQQEAARGADRDIIIADATGPNVYFGMYRTSQMTDPGWALFEAAVDHVNGQRDRAATRVWLPTYNGTLDDDFPPERDGIAVYNRLINAMGFLADNIQVGHQSTIETGDFSGYDIVIYAWIFDHDARNVLDQGKPFLTFAAGETDELGIGTGALTLHESRDFAYLLTDGHPITRGWIVGRFTLASPMFIDATTAAGNGRVLVAADPHISCGDLAKFKATCRRGKLKAVAVMVSEAHDGRQVSFQVEPGLGSHNATITGDRAKLILRRQSGDRTVSLLYPEGCAAPKDVTCP